MRDIFVAKLRETRFANSSLRSCTQFVSGHAGYLNELYMSALSLSFSSPLSTSSQTVHDDFPWPDVMTFYISVRLSTFVDGYFLVHQTFALF